MIQIYTLSDPRNNQVFYVGASRGTIKNIISRHIKDNSHFGVRSELRKAGLTPLVSFIDESNDPMAAGKLEEYWIWQFRSWGFTMDNKRLCSGYSGSSKAMYSNYWWKAVNKDSETIC